MTKKLSVRYTENPFLDELIVPVRGKNVKVSPLGKDNNVLINTVTGEHFGTHVTTVKKVDNDKFVKLFTQNIGLTFDLSKGGIKCLNILIHAVQNQSLGKDIVDLDKYCLEDFLKHNTHLKISYPSFARSLGELCDAKIIAMSQKPGRYFINPSFMFNGDRVAFTTILERERKTKQQELEAAGQQRLMIDTDND